MVLSRVNSFVRASCDQDQDVPQNSLSQIDLFGPAPARLVGSHVHQGVHDLFGEAPEQFPHVDGAIDMRGVESMSGVGSGGISMVVFIPSQNPLMW